MPRKNPVIAVTAQSEDGPLQVEVAITLRPRRPRASPTAPTAPTTQSPGSSHIPRVTRLMALAIKFQDMVDRSDIVDYAEIARLGYVTRARLTQIMNLGLLAPEIQERILDGWPADRECRESELRSVVRYVLWEDQLTALGLSKHARL